jgi:TrmH family RNA methyltransferase
MSQGEYDEQERFDAAVLARLRIVLVSPQHPGNIGAAARAMKVMGLSDLALVAPERYPHAQATARAGRAVDVLAAARVFDCLDDALADCGFAIATSARLRRAGWPVVDARAGAGAALAQSARSPVALVFGRERSGLSNAEADRCQLHLHVPTNPEYPSLNLAAAVQVVCYELRLAAGDRLVRPPPAHEPVALADMEGLFGHWQEVLIAAGFLDPRRPERLMRRLRRLFFRAAPNRSELNILRGALRALDPRQP